MITVHILGNNSALPAFGRWPSAQIVQIREQHFLVDCGEGTQVRLQQQNLGWAKIHHIFISHLHGDHFYGLIGLLTTMNLLGRKSDLHLFAPPELQNILALQLEIGGGHLNYNLKFHALRAEDPVQLLIDDKYYEVSCFPVSHRIPCYGFKFTAKNSGRKIIPDACASYDIPFEKYKDLKAGADFKLPNGTIVPNSELTQEAQLPLSYAYCADTLYEEKIIPYISDCHTIYHESTYLDIDKDKAFERFHSTALQAATIAQKAGIHRLLLGHYSSRYEVEDCFEQEARAIFTNSFATKTGDIFDIKY